MTTISQLKKKREKILKGMPDLRKILRSTISKYYLTCGYKKCRCHSGNKHGPFTYLSAKEKGKLKMYFVPKEITKEVKQQVLNYNKLWESICEVCRINREILWKERKKK